MKAACLALILGFQPAAAPPGLPQEAPGLPLPERFVPAYFRERPTQFLVDPQQLIHPSDAKEHLEFLNYHASDSAIDLYVYVFDARQNLDGALRPEEVVDAVFASGKPAAVVHYFMGKPQRAALYLSPALAEIVPQAERNRALETAVERATVDSAPSKQLEKFLIQLSIRISWMERLLDADGKEDAVPEPELVAQPAAGDTGLLSKKERLLAAVRPYGVPVAAGLGALVFGWLLRWRLKSRAQYRFPDLAVEPRLGGRHAAGIGGVITFASAATPPATQRDVTRGI